MLHTLEVNSADSPRPTRGWVTGIRLLDTSLALTNESLLTVRVNDTLGLTPGDGVGVGDEAGLTSADGVTCPRHGALSSGATGRRVTRVWLDHASLTLANISLLTIRIYDTLGLTPSDGVRIGDEAGLTSADGVTIASDGALGSRSAWRRVTRIWLHDTSLALANVSLLAVGVNDTLRPAASDGVGLGDEAGLTRANRVA